MGPPMMKRPVALIIRFMSGALSSSGTTLSITSELTASRSCSVETESSCCAAMTTACTLCARPSRYSTVTWLLPSGRRNFRSPRRALASWRVSRCASAMGRGISSGVSSQAYPNIIPWSPAPCSLPAPESTPMAISRDCCSTATITAQLRASNPIEPSLKPMRSTVRRTMFGYSRRARVVISPIRSTNPVFTAVSSATRLDLSWRRHSSSTASETWSQILSG